MSKKVSGGKSLGKSASMTKEAASRIQSASDKNPNSQSGKGGFAQRAQSAADRRGAK